MPEKPVGKLTPISDSNGPVGKLTPIGKYEVKPEEALKINHVTENFAGERKYQTSVTGAADMLGAEIDAMPNATEDEKRWLKLTRSKIGSKLEDGTVFDENKWEESRQVLNREHKDLNDIWGGRKEYYWDQNGLPKALKYGERPPLNSQVESIWGNALSADDDNGFTSLGKSTYNAFIDILKIPTAAWDVAQGLVTGEDSDLHNFAQNTVDRLKFQTSARSKESLVKSDAFESIDSFFKSDNWNPTLDNSMALLGQGLGSLAQFAVMGKVGGGAGAAEAGTSWLAANKGALAISSLISLNTALDAADRVGLEGREKYAFATTTAAGLGYLELALGGVERGLLGVGSQGAKKLISESAAKAFVESGGEITAAGLEQAFKETLKKGMSTLPSILKEGGKEAAEEVSQSYFTALSQDVYRKLGGQDNFDSEFFSSNTAKDAFEGALVGFAMGAGSKALSGRNEQQISNAYQFIKAGKTDELLQQFHNLKESGEMTQNEYDQAVFKVKNYEGYIQQFADVPLSDKEKEMAIDAIEKTKNLEAKIEQIKNEPLTDPLITGAKIKALESEHKQSINHLSDIFSGKFKDEASQEQVPKEEANKEPVSVPEKQSVPNETLSQEPSSQQVPSREDLPEGFRPVEPDEILPPGYKTTLDYKGTGMNITNAPPKIKESEPTPEPAKPSGFSQVANEKIPDRNWNSPKVDDSEKADILKQHLESTPGNSIEGTLQLRNNVNGEFSAYDVDIDGKRFKVASRDFMDTSWFKEGYLGKNVVDLPVKVKLIKPTDENLKSIKDIYGKPLSSHVIKNENGEPFGFGFTHKGKYLEYPGPILQIVNANNNKTIGNIRVTGKSGIKDVAKGMQRPSAKNPSYTIRTKGTTYSISKEGDNLIVKDQSGNEVGQAEKRNALKKYEKDYDYDTGDRIESFPEGIYSPEDLYGYIANTSKNPAEVAEAYQQALKDSNINSGDYKEKIIAESKPKIKRGGYVRFGDSKKITPKINKNYFDEKGRHIDDLAMELTEMAGIEITEQDIVDFIDKYPSMKDYEDYLKSFRPQHLDDLKGRFKALTGFDLKQSNVIAVLDNALKAEGVNYEDYIQVEPINKSYEELVQDYEAQYEQAIYAESDADVSATAGGTESEGQTTNGPEQNETKLGPQKSKDTIERKSLSSVNERNKLIEILQKAIPKIKVIDDSSIDAVGQLDSDGKTVRLNPKYNFIDVPIHEFGHAFIDMMGGNSDSFIRSGIEQLRGTKLWDKVARKYQELTPEMLEKEVLATAIGNEGALLYENQKVKSAFRNWLDVFFMKLKRLLGIEKNVARNIAGQLLAGKKLPVKKINTTGSIQKSKKDEEKKTIISVRLPSFNKWAKDTKFKLGEHYDRIYELENQLEGASADEKDRIQGEIEIIESIIDQKKIEHAQYVEDLNYTIDLINGKKDISKMSIDEMSEARALMSKYNDLKYTRFYKDLLFQIGQYANTQGINNISSTDPNYDPSLDNSEDLRQRDVVMQGLSTISEKFPAIQHLYKLYRSAFSKMSGEKIEIRNKAEKLASAVIKEYNSKAGIGEKAKNFFTGGGHKYFSYLAKDGHLMDSTYPEYQKLSKAQRELLDYMNEVKTELSQYAGLDGDVLLKSGAGFIESLGKQGIFKAYANYLTKDYNVRNVKVKFKDPKSGITDNMYFGDVEQVLNNYASNGTISKAQALSLVTKYNLQAKNLLAKKTNADGTPIDIKGGGGRFYMAPDGTLVPPMAGDFKGDFTENYYESFMHFVSDAVFSKHMSPIMPIYDGVESFYKSMGNSKENVVKFLDVAKRGHFLQETIGTGMGSGFDSLLKVLRKWTSLRFMAFNWPTNAWNVINGKYQQFRKEGLGQTIKGDKRFSKKKGRNILKKYAPDTWNDTGRIDPEKHAGRIFELLSFGGMRYGEIFIRGSAILGSIPNNQYNWINPDGSVKGKDAQEIANREKIIQETVNQAKSETEAVQGRYSETEKRNFAYFELGRFMGQFKMWIPEMISERFEKKYIDADGITREGSLRTMWNYGMRDLMKDVRTKDFYTSNDIKHVNMRKNFRGSIVMASLLMMYLSDSDDPNDKKNADLLAKLLKDVGFVYNLENAIFLVKQPFAAMATVVDFLNALNAAFHGATYKNNSKYGEKGDFKAPGMFFNLVPGNKLIQTPKKLLDEE